MGERYGKHGKSSNHVQTMRAEGGNAAEITSHHVHGSPGMKSDSKANDILGTRTSFDPAASQQFYRKSASSNKKNPVGNVEFLKKPSAMALAEYEANLRGFRDALQQFSTNSDPKRIALKNTGNDLLEHVQEIKSDESIGSNDLSDLSAVLLRATESLQAPTPQNIMKLAGLSKKVSGKESPKWKALGTCLLVFACSVLVVAGVLLAVPTLGTSLMTTVVGAAGLATFVGGASLYGTSSEKGLAKGISNFKLALTDMKVDSHDEKEEIDPSPPSP
jgi:hypothetical protein